MDINRHTHEHQHNYGIDLDALTANIVDLYHLDPELVAVGVAWARDWHALLNNEPVDDLDIDRLMATRDISLDGLPVPRDSTEGRPTFRVRYAAERALLSMMEDNDTVRQLIDGRGHQIVPDFARIDTVLTTLLDSYTRKLFPYNLDSTRLPQDPRHMPRRPEFQKTPGERIETDSIKLANFWFADCYYMRGVNDSNDMTVNLSALYEDHPDLFDPHHAIYLEPQAIERLLLEYHLPVQHKQISEFWVENARRMVERYDGDSRMIFSEFGTYDELVRRARNDFKGGGFLGFQKKMTSMLSYFLMANELIPYQNIPLPVDFHVMRMSISTEMIAFPDIIEPQAIDLDRVTDFLRELYYDFADHHDISQLDLCDVVWLYSREACSHSPTNAQKVIGKRHGRHTVWGAVLASAEYATDKQITTYQNSCGICRIAEYCAHNVPSGEYYVSGRIVHPNPKYHLGGHEQDSLHSEDTLTNAQQGGRKGVHHEIDRRAHSRELERQRRASIIRGLAQPALILLTILDGAKIQKSMIQTEHIVGNSLYGKRFSFTRTEVVEALGHEPTLEELDALRPYLNEPTTLF